MTLLRACLTCGRPFTPANRRQRRCLVHQPTTRTGAWRGSTSAWRRVRLLVLERDGYRCRWCGGLADQADHLLPRSRGGSDDPANLVAACGHCNRRRGAALPVRLDVEGGPSISTGPRQPDTPRPLAAENAAGQTTSPRV
jgi:5-methylcytosine-specific restriction endonuclease McrA